MHAYADLREVRPSAAKTTTGFPRHVRTAVIADFTARFVTKSILSDESAASAGIPIVNALPTNPSQAAPHPSTNISPACSTANTRDTDCAQSTGQASGLSSPYFVIRPSLRIRCLPCRMPRMLQPVGVSARPALIKPVPLNCTLRSPDPRPSPIKPPERCPHCNSRAS